MQITRATLGFIFSPDFKRVLLIHKNRPANQAGKVNGIGGKCEGDEAFIDCMSREVREETGLNIPNQKWTFVGDITAPHWEINIFATSIDKTATPTSVTDEQIKWYPVNNLPPECISNLTWLIPLSLNILTKDFSEKLVVHVQYSLDSLKN